MIYSPWFVPITRAPHAQMRLFCFHYAGGSASLFREWSALLPSDVEVLGVELPGHSTRFSEPLVRATTPLIAELRQAMSHCLDKPYAFFGHSMGALLAYELASTLHDKGLRSPNHLIVSGCRAPTATRDVPKYSELPDAEFIEHLRSADGAIEDVFRVPELVKLLLPIWRADFELSEQHQHTAHGRRLSCTLTALGGLMDQWISEDDILAWRQFTSGAFFHRIFDGGHMFLHTHKVAVVGAVRDALTRPLEAVA